MRKIIFACIFFLIVTVVYFGMTHFRYSLSRLITKAEFTYAYVRYGFLKHDDGDIVNAATNTSQNLGIPVLLYHGIVAIPDRFSTTQTSFADQMAALYNAGYRTITMQELDDYLSGKQVTLPEKPFVLTFDDGRKDSYLGADPILAIFGFKATMFLPSIIIERNQAPVTKYYLLPNDVADMAGTGRWEIESHAIQAEGGFIPIDAKGNTGNLLSNKMWLSQEGRVETDDEYARRIDNEMRASYETIAEYTGIAPISFAYPFGDYGQQTVNYPGADKIVPKIVARYYKMAFRQVWPRDIGYTFNYPGENMMTLRRVEPASDITGDGLLATIENGATKSLPFADDFEKNNGWRTTWGNFTADKGEGTLAGTETSSGAFVFLDGSLLWKDYRFAISGDTLSNVTISLMGRYIDADDYASCIFNKDWVKIEVYRNGVRTLATGYSYPSAHSASTEHAVDIAGGKISCEEDGRTILGSPLDQEDEHEGGAGIKVWSQDPSQATYTMKHADVTPMSAIAEMPGIPNTGLSVITGATSTNEEKAVETLAHFSPPSIVPLSERKGVTTSVPNDPPAISLPYDENFTTWLWSTRQGSIAPLGNAFLLSANATSTGAEFLKEGTALWKDYEFLAHAKWRSTGTVSLIFRKSDEKDFLECAYTRGANSGSVALYTTENGKQITLYRAPAKLLLSERTGEDEANLGVEVESDKISCLFNGNPVITYTHERMQSAGGIGFRLWSSVPGMSALISGIKVKL